MHYIRQNPKPNLFGIHFYLLEIKGAVINIFIFIKGHIAECNVKCLACSDKHSENHHPTLQFPLTLRSSLFWFSSRQLTVFVQSQHSHH